MASKTLTIFGPPDLFAQDMRQIINDQEFRCALASSLLNGKLIKTNSDITFIVGEEKEKIHAHKVILSGRCVGLRLWLCSQLTRCVGQRCAT